jgi:acyl-CoA thioesterase
MTAMEMNGTVTIERNWWSAAGAHGGLLASLGLRAMAGARLAAAAYEQPVRSVSTHYLASVDERALAIEPVVQRVGRGSAVLTFTATQGKTVALLGSSMFGASRRGPSYAGSPPPEVPGPQNSDPVEFRADLAPFSQHVEVRAATPSRPFLAGKVAELTGWVRFQDDRPLDAEAITILTDIMPPALFAVWTEPFPVPSAELTVHFGASLDAGPARGWALVRMETRDAGNGWAVDDSTIWSEDGEVLALARQSRLIISRKNWD